MSVSAEPISVRIARLKGCEPVSDGAGGWMCQCALNTHGDWCAQCSDRHEYINDAWLTPAASFALQAEMVEHGVEVIVVRRMGPTRSFLAILDRDLGDGPFQQRFEGPTLGEAIALAYEAWATAKGARQ